MTSFSITNAIIEDPIQQKNNQDLLKGLNALGQFIFYGAGVPTFTPTGRAIFIRTNGGAGSTLYVWEGAAWAAK